MKFRQGTYHLGTGIISFSVQCYKTERSVHQSFLLQSPERKVPKSPKHYYRHMLGLVELWQNIKISITFKQPWTYEILNFVALSDKLLLSENFLKFYYCIETADTVGRQEGHPVRKKYGDDGGRGHWLVRMDWRPAGWLVCLPLLIFPCTIKSRSSRLAPAQPGGPGKRAVKQLCVCVCVCVCIASKKHKQTYSISKFSPHNTFKFSKS